MTDSWLCHCLLGCKMIPLATKSWFQWNLQNCYKTYHYPCCFIFGCICRMGYEANWCEQHISSWQLVWFSLHGATSELCAHILNFPMMCANSIRLSMALNKHQELGFGVLVLVFLNLGFFWFQVRFFFFVHFQLFSSSIIWSCLCG